MADIRVKAVELTARNYAQAVSACLEFEQEKPRLFALRQDGGLRYYAVFENTSGQSTLAEWTEQAAAHWAPGEW